MFYIGTGKAPHGYRVTVIMDDSRFVYACVFGTWRMANTRKGEKYSELEKRAIEQANRSLQLFGEVTEVGEPGKSRLMPAFFSTMACELFALKDFKNAAELGMLIDDFIDYYNYDRLHASLKYRTPAEQAGRERNGTRKNAEG